MRGDGATWHENALVPILRNGRLDEVYWTYSYSPIDYEHAATGVGGVLVLCTETTRSVLAERATAEAEARWRALFDQAPEFMCTLRGPEHRFDAANPGYFRLVGRNDILGKTVLEAFPEVARQGYIALLDQVYRSGEPFTATALPLSIGRSTDGAAASRFIDFVYQPIRDVDGRVAGIFVLGSDVTERVRASVALVQSEARYRALAERLPGGAVFVVDRELRFVTAAGEALAGREFELEHADHGRFYLTRGVPLVDESGEVYAVLAASYDIIARRQVETDLRAASQRLEAMISAAEIGLWIWDLRNDRIEVDRNLRNPLAPIRSAARILTTENLGAGELTWCRDVIQRQVQHMAHLLDDLLDVSRITQQRLRLEKEVVDLATVVSSAVETAKPAIDGRRHRLTLSLPTEPVLVDVDPGRLSQVLSNLLNNAAKYTDVGGEIELAAGRVGDEVQIAVRDNGASHRHAGTQRL